MADTSAVIAAIGALASISAVLGWVVKYVIKDFNKTQRELSQNLSKGNDLTEKQLVISKERAERDQERDKRDQEFHSNVMEQFAKLSAKQDKTIEAVNNINFQHVGTQVVDKTVVKE